MLVCSNRPKRKRKKEGEYGDVRWHLTVTSRVANRKLATSQGISAASSTCLSYGIALRLRVAQGRSPPGPLDRSIPTKFYPRACQTVIQQYTKLYWSLIKLLVTLCVAEPDDWKTVQWNKGQLASTDLTFPAILALYRRWCQSGWNCGIVELCMRLVAYTSIDMQQNLR